MHGLDIAEPRRRMKPGLCDQRIGKVADLPTEDVVFLAPGTLWQVPWELTMLGPFMSCVLLDGHAFRHVTVPTMMASAVRRTTNPDAALAPSDYPALPVLSAEMSLLDAAVSVLDNGWELAVVTADDVRVITARSVYRALVRSDEVTGRVPPPFRFPVASTATTTSTRT